VRETADRDVLLLHGFTGVPAHLESLRDALNAHGFHPIAPLLPGHGTSARDLGRTAWRDWHRAAAATLDTLGPRVAIAGLSMGALLAILLAAERPDRVRAAVLMSTPLWLPPHLSLTYRVVSRLLPYFPKGGMDVRDPDRRQNVPGYSLYPVAAVRSLVELMGEAKRAAPRVTAPMLLVHARQDHSAPLACADWLEQALGGPVRRVTLEDSYHVVTLDVERDRVAQVVTDFFEETP